MSQCIGCLTRQKEIDDLVKIRLSLESGLLEAKRELAQLRSENVLVKEELLHKDGVLANYWFAIDEMEKERDALRVSCDELAKALEALVESNQDIAFVKQALAKHRRVK